MINWEEIEKACMSLEKDCVPQNAREWDVFIRQYENCLEYHEGRGHDFTFDGMASNERQELVDKHMCLGRGFKKSLFECYVDLTDEEKDLFEGVDWNAVNLVKLIWTAENIYLPLCLVDLKSLPRCPKFVIGHFFCGNELTSLEGAPEWVGGDFWCADNRLTTLMGAPKHVGGDFCCANNRLTTLMGAPKHVGGRFYCDNNHLMSLEGAPERVGGRFDCVGNKLPKSIPDSFHGKHIKKYVGLKESFVMRWNEFNK
jgi:hypothetical protein